MSYSPATDFLAVWRNIAGAASKVEMPGLDYVVAALARAGLITLSVSATAPVVNQSTTAWLHCAVPSYSAEGALFLWNKTLATYQPATAALFLQLLEAAAGESGASWWTCTGLPSNTLGNNGDFVFRLDAPNGVYGPKAAGAWPATPIPGTADVLTSTSLDNTFGPVQGELIYRGPATWQALPIGAANAVVASSGTVPQWKTLSALMDAVFGNVVGSILYRGAGVWAELPPGVANQVLATGGPGASPAWAARSTEFSSGDTLVFHQTTAPVGWTKQTAINDYGLRVTSGVVGSTAGNPFSSVFAQTAVGNTTLTAALIPQHTHSTLIVDFPTQIGAGTSGGGLAYSSSAGHSYVTDGGTGGSGPHTHSVNLALSYTDVIIASKN